MVGVAGGGGGGGKMGGEREAVVCCVAVSWSLNYWGPPSHRDEVCE
jgi:hypothetical protein